MKTGKKMNETKDMFSIYFETRILPHLDWIQPVQTLKLQGRLTRSLFDNPIYIYAGALTAPNNTHTL